MEVSDVRRRLRAAIEKSRLNAAERRTRGDLAVRAYEEFLEQKAVPLVHQVASALVAEGHVFKVFTPAGSVRLASDRSPESFVEVGLDDAVDPPQVVVRTTRGRGRRMISEERPLNDGVPINELTEDELLAVLLEEVLSLF